MAPRWFLLGILALGMLVPATGSWAGTKRIPFDGVAERIRRNSSNCSMELDGVTDEICVEKGGNAGIYRCPAPGDCSGTTAWERIDGSVTPGSITEPDLDEDSGTPTDGDHLTYDSTGTNFNWVDACGTDLTNTDGVCDVDAGVTRDTEFAVVVPTSVGTDTVTSNQLAQVLTDETGFGSIVRHITPTFIGGTFTVASPLLPEMPSAANDTLSAVTSKWVHDVLQTTGDVQEGTPGTGLQVQDGRINDVQVRKVERFGVGRMTTDGTNCLKPAGNPIQFASGPKYNVISCPLTGTNVDGEVWGHMRLPPTFVTSALDIAMDTILLNAPSGSLERIYGVFELQCLATGEQLGNDTTNDWVADTQMNIIETAGDSQYDIRMRSGEATVTATSCAANDTLFWRWTACDGGGDTAQHGTCGGSSDTNAIADLRILRLQINYTADLGE